MCPRLLAGEFVRMGHTSEARHADPLVRKSCCFRIRVIRRPRPLQLLGLLRWCEVYFHNHISLRTAWPLLFVRRPWVVTHETWIPFSGLTGRLKHWAIGVAINVSVSTAIARHVGAPTVIGNPYDDEGFRDDTGHRQRQGTGFLRPLGFRKGSRLAAQRPFDSEVEKTSSTANDRWLRTREPKLRAMAGDLGIADQVTFAGVKKGRELAEYLNAHKIMVVPSL